MRGSLTRFVTAVVAHVCPIRRMLPKLIAFDMAARSLLRTGRSFSARNLGIAVLSGRAGIGLCPAFASDREDDVERALQRSGLEVAGVGEGHEQGSQ